MNAPVTTSRIVRGHRRCVQCGYGLTGQPVLHDEHHGLFLARCPECGRVASLEHQPLLGRAASPLRVVMAFAWTIVVVAAWIGGGAAIGGLCVASAQVGANGYAVHLNERFRDEIESPAGAIVVQQVVVGPRRPGQRTVRRPVFATWWEAQDQAAMLDAAGGRLGAISPVFLLVWIPTLLGTLVLGVFWAVVLHQLRLARRLLLAVPLVAPALAIAAINLAAWRDGMIWSAWVVAVHEIGPPVLVMSVVAVTLGLALGLAIGRRIGRGMLRLTVPVSLRSAIVPLWLTDGLEPPLRTRSSAPRAP